MAIEIFNRHEMKFLMTEETVRGVEQQLMRYMEPDGYNRNHEFYTISNIYYDTRDNHLIRHSLCKPKYKEKLRLRAYGIPGADDKVYLEIKKKVLGVVNKRRTTLKLQEAYRFADTGIKPEIKEYMNPQVVSEIAYLLKMYDLEPKLYLAYDRRALFDKENRDLRITFDTNIRSRRMDLKLENGDYGESLLGQGQWLMEVKAEKSIPLWLSKLLAEHKIFKTSFSKYGKAHQTALLKDRNMKGEENVCLNHYLPQPQLMPQSL